MKIKNYLCGKNIAIIALSAFILLQFIIIKGKSVPVIIDGAMLQYYNSRGGCVPSEEYAKQIAKVIYKVRTGIDFNENDFVVSDSDYHNTWNVHLADDGENYLDYNGVYIDKDYATIVMDAIHIEVIQKRYGKNKE